MNLVLLFASDFDAEGRARIRGRRAQHVREVHRAAPGDALVVGLAGGRIGAGHVLRMDDDAIEMEVALDREPPPPSQVSLVLALPRPKVLNRVIASAASMGIKRICLVNAWRVEKSYWKSPRLTEETLRMQSIVGLEQARDTILPEVTLHRFFRRFVEEELPALATGTRTLVAHPPASEPCPRALRDRVTLAIGPEGGFIDEEIASFERIGFTPVSLGERILRVETAVTALISRLTA